MRKELGFILVLGLLSVSPAKSDHLETLAQWRLLDFAFPYDPAFLMQFEPQNVVPTGLEIAWHRIFIAMPRLRAGVPATLAYIPRDIPLGSTGLQLQPYPSWDWHSAGKGDFNCSKLISVYRTRVDKCNRLWVLDSGINTSIDDFTVMCPPKIYIFDLQTDQLVRIITFPRQSVRPNSLFTNLIIDDTTANTCDDVHVYISDTTGPGLVVFEGASDRSWRFLHASMLPNVEYVSYQIGTDTFELFDGIVGLAFSPRLATLYYQPLATDRLFSVPTSALRAGPPAFGDQLPVKLIGRKSSQGIGLGLDPRDDTIIFSPLTETAVAAWQPRTNSQRILAYNPEQIQFAAEIRWAERDNGNIWVLTSRFQKFFLKTIKPRDINIRILRIRPEEVIPRTSYLSHHYSLPTHATYTYNHTLDLFK